MWWRNKKNGGVCGRLRVDIEASAVSTLRRNILVADGIWFWAAVFPTNGLNVGAN